MGLLDVFRPKWKNSDSDVRLAAAREMKDIKVWIEMACTDRDWFVRHAIFDLIRDSDPSDNIYVQLGSRSIDEEIRRKAVKKVRDEKLLEAILPNEKYTYVREAIEHRIAELKDNMWGEKSEGSSTQAQASS